MKDLEVENLTRGYLGESYAVTRSLRWERSEDTVLLALTMGKEGALPQGGRRAPEAGRVGKQISPLSRQRNKALL